MRKKYNLNQNWNFNKADSIIAEVSTSYHEWEEVCLPHTWNAIDGANGNDYYRGVGWYVKELSISEKESQNRLFLEFLGSNSVTEVYVNQQYIGQHQGGYSTFRFDITDAITFGKKNTLAIKVDNQEYPDVYPLRADFTFYGGVYRGVNLISVSPLHFALDDFGSTGIYVEQTKVTNERAELTITAKFQNQTSDCQKTRMWIEVYDQDEQLVTYVGKDILLESGQSESSIPLAIENPTLWDGQHNPYCYTFKISLQQFNDTIDQLSIPIGLRYFEVDPENGFSLNGRLLRLNGVSRHQDYKDKGWALTQANHDQDMALIKEIGATSIRLAHYQHDPYFYDLCDREGMVVWAEIPFITELSKGKNPMANAEQQLIELIRQNYNHPSIFFWGIQNEIQIDHRNDQKTRPIVKALNELAKKEDSTRLTTMANVLTVEDTDEYNYMTDVIGFNKYYGWYMGQPEDFAAWIDQYHATNPQTALAISEYGAEGIIEYHSSQPKVKDYTEEYHSLFHEKVWEIFSKRKFLWATYVWNMFDFGANVRDEGGVKGRNNKGLVTYDRQVKKDAFYMYQAHWSEKPVLHITGKRYIQRAAETIALKIYTNCENVILTVNGIEVQTIQSLKRVIVFPDVLLQPGENILTVSGKKENIQLSDEVRLVKVAKEPSYYEAPVENVGENVQNWFDVPELDDSETIEEFTIPQGVYSSQDTIEELMSIPETKEILIETFGDLTAIPMYGMMKNMKIDTLAQMDQDSPIFSKIRINKLNRQLIQIKK